MQKKAPTLRRVADSNKIHVTMASARLLIFPHCRRDIG
jgi:hypothetical protein